MLKFIPLAADLVPLSQVPPMTWVWDDIGNRTLLHLFDGHIVNRDTPAMTRWHSAVNVRILGPCVPPESPGKVMLLRHVGGHSERHTLDAPRDTKGPGGKPNKTDLHGIKSTLTYCQRTLLCSVWNLQLCADDDGNAGARVGPANGPITAEQRDEIERGMKETGGDWDRFYTAYSISGLDQLQQSQFRDVMARLEQKRRGAK